MSNYILEHDGVYALDLHGDTKSEAKPKIDEFIAWALSRGLARIRVIHGCGHHSPNGEAVLKPIVHKILESDGWANYVSSWHLDSNGGATLIKLNLDIKRIKKTTVLKVLVGVGVALVASLYANKIKKGK